MNDKLVSIIILSYRNLNYLMETIDSVLAQTYSNIELIIGDDGTPNFNKETYLNYIINSKNNGNIKNIQIYTNKVNLGIPKNVNKAIKKSKGKYIKLIAADDNLYEINTISKMVNFMQNNNSLIMTSNLLFCNEIMEPLMDSQKRIDLSRDLLKQGNNSEEFFKILSKKCFIGAPTVMFNKELFDKYGLFGEEYNLIEDWQMWLRLSRQGVKFDYYDDITVKYRCGVGVSTSASLNLKFIKDLIKCHEKEILPYRKELGYWLHKKIKWAFVRKYKYNQYSLIKKLLSITCNLDIIFINRTQLLFNKIFRRKNEE